MGINPRIRSTTREHGGLGLGLAIVKDLTELHSGTVRGISAGLGKGATFVVSLPRLIDFLDHAANGGGSLVPGAPPDEGDVLAMDDKEDGLDIVSSA
jgi:hypothetical protein